jgi:hypothetical protein
MSEETGKAIEAMRGRVNDLYLRRGEEVRLAREIRESVGRQTGAYDLVWHRAEALTREIAAAEEELKALERDNPVGQLLEALDMIAEMPFYDPEAGITTEQLVTQYDFARETARLAVACYERVSGEVAHG